jgi:uncharacterized protein YraI
MAAALDKPVNCRFGPGTVYLAIGALNVGAPPVQILGKNADGSWFEIDNPTDPGVKCWVSNTIVQTSGNLTLVPVFGLPSPYVVALSISVTPNWVVCPGPNSADIQGTISTNGPVTVKWNINIWNRDTNTKITAAADQTLVFTKADTKTVNPGTWAPASCGHYYAKLTITSPAPLPTPAKHNFDIVPIVCLSAHTLIDTPQGQIPVEDLRAGDLVWTSDGSGRRFVAPIIQVRRVAVPATHQMVHLTLSDGRELLASPGHPTADGRTLGGLKIGDWLDGARVTGVERVYYDQGYTYDLLPAGATGFYWADNILMGSTLAER